MPRARLSLAIAAPVRSEAPYLLEWIAFHRALGVKAFILGDNGGDDGTSELIHLLHERGVVIRLDCLGARYFQLQFNALALNVARLLCNGLVFIDVDEFLRPLDGHASIAAVTQAWLAEPTIGAVALNWAIFGTSGRTEPGEGLVIERFTRRAEQGFLLNRHTKPFVRVDACEKPHGNPHAMDLRSGRYVDSSGQDVAWDTGTGAQMGITAEVKWHGLRIDHFVLKSAQEFEIKKKRGDVASTGTERGRQQPHYLLSHDRNEVEDPMPAWIVERTKQELERLRSVLGPSWAPFAQAAG